MTAALSEFHFLRPWGLLLLLPLGYLVARLWRHAAGRGFWQQICDPALIPFVVTDLDGERRRRKVLPFALGGLCAVLALAGPTYERAPQPVFRDQAALVLLLDLSSSMSASDVTPSRLDRARFKIKDLLSGRHTGQTALVVFAAQAFSVTPLTDDVKTIESQLQVLTPELMPRQGSGIPRALRKGVELLKQAGFGHGDLLLITDSLHERDLKPALAELAGGEFRLSVLGVGTTAGSPIPLTDGGFVTDREGGIVLSKLTPDTLGQLAQRGHGLYQSAGADNAEITALQAFFATGTRGSDATATDRSATQWRELGPWLLLPVLWCSCLAFRHGALLVLLALSLGHLSAARADWFRTPDQAGSREFRAERYAAAAETFENPDWRAASLYRAGKFADTLESLKHAKSTTDFYNKGNALARLGRFEDAISAYEQALQLTPDDPDATYNRDLLRDLVKQQQPQDESKKQDQQKPRQNDQQGGEAENEQASQGDQGQSKADEAGENTAQRPPAANEDPAQNDREAEQGKRARDARKSESANAKTADPEQQAAAEQAAAQAREAAADPEKALATEQWLRQIPDDPGGLLRRKFLYQYGRLHDQEPEQAEPW